MLKPTGLCTTLGRDVEQTHRPVGHTQMCGLRLRETPSWKSMLVSYLPAPKWDMCHTSGWLTPPNTPRRVSGEREEGRACCASKGLALKPNRRPRRKWVKRKSMPSCSGRVPVQHISISFSHTDKLLSHSTSFSSSLFSNYYVVVQPRLEI